MTSSSIKSTKLAVIPVAQISRLRFALEDGVLAITLAGPESGPSASAPASTGSAPSDSLAPLFAAIAANPDTRGANNATSAQPAASVQPVQPAASTRPTASAHPTVSSQPAQPAPADTGHVPPDSPIETPSRESDPPLIATLADGEPDWPADADHGRAADGVRYLASRWSYGPALVAETLRRHGASHLARVAPAERAGVLADLVRLGTIFNQAASIPADVESQRGAALDVMALLGSKGYALLADQVLRDVAGGAMLAAVPDGQVRDVFSALYAALGVAGLWSSNDGFGEEYLAAWSRVRVAVAHA